MAERKYAEGTTVSASRTEAEIKDLLAGKGVKKIIAMNDAEAGRFTLVFEHEARSYKVEFPLPDAGERRFTQYVRAGVRYDRAPTEARKLYDQEVNRRWRAFGQVIKSKLIAVEEGISTIEREFFANTVLANGMTVYESGAAQMKALPPGKPLTLALGEGSR